jgi:hypothetical protein
MKLLPREFANLVKVGDKVLWIKRDNEDELYLSEVTMRKGDDKEERLCVFFTTDFEEYKKKSYLHKADVITGKDKRTYFFIGKGYNIDSWRAYLIEDDNDLDNVKTRITLKELKK